MSLACICCTRLGSQIRLDSCGSAAHALGMNGGPPSDRNPPRAVAQLFSKGIWLDGLFLMALSAFWFSLLSSFVKMVSARIPTVEVVFFRGAINAALILAVHAWRRQPARELLGQNRRMLLVRGLFGSAAVLLNFYSISQIPVATAYLLFQLAPVFVMLLAGIFLGEGFSRRQAGLVAVTLAGVLLVMRVDTLELRLGELAAVSSAVFGAAAYVSVKKLSSEAPQTVVLYFAVFSSLIAAPWMVSGFVLPDGREALILLAIGVLAALGQLFMTMAYQRDQAGRVSMGSYLGVVFSGVFDFLFWAYLPNWSTLAGAALILAAFVGLRMTVRAERRTARSGIDPPRS